MIFLIFLEFIFFLFPGKRTDAGFSFSSRPKALAVPASGQHMGVSYRGTLCDFGRLGALSLVPSRPLGPRGRLGSYPPATLVLRHVASRPMGPRRALSLVPSQPQAHGLPRASRLLGPPEPPRAPCSFQGFPRPLGPSHKAYQGFQGPQASQGLPNLPWTPRGTLVGWVLTFWGLLDWIQISKVRSRFFPGEIPASVAFCTVI